jgi:hypothetical protein
VQSNLVPNENPIYAIQCRLSCLHNTFSSNSQLLHVFTYGGVDFGNLIDASPKFIQSVPCSGSHKDIYISLFDENGNILNLIDPNILIKLSFKQKIKNV